MSPLTYPLPNDSQLFYNPQSCQLCRLTIRKVSSSLIKGERSDSVLRSPSLRANYFRKVEDGCVDIYFYDWHYFGSYTSSLIFQLFNEGIRLPNQPNIITTTYNFSKSPSKSCSGCTSGRQLLFVAWVGFEPTTSRL